MKEKTFTKGSSRIALIGMLFLMLAAFVMLMPLNSYAASSSGTCKGVSWEIDSKGVLTLGKKGETQVLDNTATEAKVSEDYIRYDDPRMDVLAMVEKWHAIRDEWEWLTNGRDERITKIVIAGNIQAKGSLQFIFSGLSNLESLSGMDKIDTKEVTSVSYLFNKRTVDPETEKLVDYGAPKLKSIEEIKSWDVSNIKKADLAFGSTGVEEIDLSAWTTSSKLETFASVFENCRDLKTIKFGEGLDTSNARFMGYIFKFCTNLTTIEGLQYLDTDSAVTMIEMFHACRALESVDLSNFNTANCTDMKDMFRDCQSLEEIDVSNFNTSKVTDMSAMFISCLALKKLDVSGFDTSEVKYMTDMIRNCQSLKQIYGIGNLNMSKVRDAAMMLRANWQLELINGLEKLEIDHINNVSTMFARNDSLRKPFDAILADSAASDEAKASAQAAIDALDVLFDVTTTDDEIKEAFAILKANYPVIYGTEAYKDKVSELIDTAKAASAKVAALESEANNAKVIAELAKQKAEASMKEAEAAFKNNPSSPETIKAAEKALEDAKASEKASADAERAANNAATAANYAMIVAQNAKEAANANGDPALVDEADALPDGIAAKERTADAAVEAGENLEGAREHRKNAEELYWKAFYADTDKALTDAKDALQKAKDSKTAADAVAAAKPGPDEAVKAAEEATAKAETAVAKADEAVKAAELSGNEEKLEEAKALKAEADKALADALKLEAEQKVKRAEANPSEANKKAALDAANKALEAAKKVYGEGSAEAQAAQALVDKANTLPVTGTSKTFVVDNNTYRVDKEPDTTGDGDVTLILAKNAKSVKIPNTVTYEGKTYEVVRVGAKAFRAKKIRKVTLGANVEKIDKNAFKKSKVSTVVLKTKYLTKAKVKGSLKGSKVKTIKVKVGGSKKAKQKLIKKYKKFFTKANAGKKVTVK